MILSGWGNYPRADVCLLNARGENEICLSIANNSSLISRGMGRSYGDAALNRSATLSLLSSDRILVFDAVTGILTCEAGVVVEDLLNLFVPRGWFMPVTPGTKFVTIGGMIAADVHGKNHHVAGSFSNYLENIVLARADGCLTTCSRTENADLYAATCGGMGLTGIIAAATVRMKRINTAYIRQKIIRAANLTEAMNIFEASKEWTYSVAWIDGLARDERLGRSVVYLGEHAEIDELCADKKSAGNPLQIKIRHPRRIPFNFPGFALNRWSIFAFNHAYYGRANGGNSIVDYEAFFYPLDSLHEWNRIYGRRGFVQYQCVLPKAASSAGLQTLLSRISKSGLAPFLAVLKLLGPERGFLSFPMEGYTLALDFAVSAPVFNLLNELDAIVADYGGRIYLAKDARMARNMMHRGYPNLDAFLKLRHQVDSQCRFSSLLSERLGL